MQAVLFFESLDFVPEGWVGVLGNKDRSTDKKEEQNWNAGDDVSRERISKSFMPARLRRSGGRGVTKFVFEIDVEDPTTSAQRPK